MESAQFKLRLNQTEQVKKAIEDSEKILDGFDSVDTIIYASFYRVSAEYYKVKADYAQYYKSALLYLASSVSWLIAQTIKPPRHMLWAYWDFIRKVSSSS